MYDGAPCFKSRQGPRSIQRHSLEEQIIADTLEVGLGLQEAQHLVNEHRISCSQPLVGKTAVRTAYLALEPVRQAVQKDKQGNADPESDWARCRLNLVTQLAIRLGVHVWDATTLGPPPEHFDVAALSPLEHTQIVFWDEMHTEQTIGFEAMGPTAECVRFPRNADGALHTGGDISKPATQVTLKYPQESRVCLGCAVVDRPGQPLEGVRCEPFFYSGKWVVTRSDWAALEVVEIARVKALGPTSQWAPKKRDFASTGIYQGDVLSVLEGVGGKLEAHLLAHGVDSVAALARVSDALLVELARNIPRLGLERLRGLRKICEAAHDGEYSPDVVDHRLAVHPYKSRFSAAWEAELAKSPTLRGHVCIETIVEHIYNESKKVMAGTAHESDWLFSHDALSQMTAAATVKWMKERDIYKHWLLPEKGLNSSSARYKDRPIGNSPEVMPWDCALNKDIKDQIKRHVAFTSGLLDTDVRKFSKATPSKIDSAISRLFDPSLPVGAGVPSSRRIIQDVSRCMGTNLLGIIEAGGVVVQGLGDRNGRRRRRLGKRGGLRVRSESYAVGWLHDDALEGRRLLLEKSKSIWNKKESVTCN